MLHYVPEPITEILVGGGIRSLVATAIVLSRTNPLRVSLLHLCDHRTNSRRRLEYVRQQARHFGISKRYELQLPRLKLTQDPATANETATPPLLRPRVVMLGLAHAIVMEAKCLIWPAQFNDAFDDCAQVTEQAVLMQTLAQLDYGHEVPEIETPLLELDDQQVIELGAQLEVPWELAWTCLLHGESPCRVCDACQCRRAAFDAASMVDPLEEPVGVGR